MDRRAALALVAGFAVVLSGCFGGGSPNTPPVATANASATFVAAGDEVIFTGTAVDAGGSIASVRWQVSAPGIPAYTIGDRLAVAFRFALPANYTVTFTATDDLGAAGSANVNITVVARFSFFADWGASAAFVVKCPVALDPALTVVTATPAGAPTVTYRLNEGLEIIDNKTLRVSLAATQLERYGVIEVNATYNGTASGSRSFRAVPFIGAENATSVVYTTTIDDTRLLPDANTTKSAQGETTVAAVGSTAVLSFSGSETSNVSSEEEGNFSNASYVFASLEWNHSLSLTTGVFSSVDYAWDGVGTLTSEGPTTLPTSIALDAFHGTRYLGGLNSLYANGTGTFGVPGTANGGTIDYHAVSTGSVSATDGEGVSRAALRIVETRYTNGTVGGANYNETNSSESIEVASDAFVNPQIFVAWNTTGYAGTNSLASTGSFFVDSNADGTFNPDPRPSLPYDGQYFVGLAPSQLETGDAFTLHNALGASLRLVAGVERTDVLIADGFSSVAIQVVPLTGNIVGPGQDGNFEADVVASGPLSGLRLHSHVALASATGAIAVDWTLARRGA